MATTEKYRDTPTVQPDSGNYVPVTCGGYSRTEPRILTDDFAHELAIANRERRAQRCPWLEQNLARLSEISMAGAGYAHGAK
jgi:hypothetical protein